MSTQVVPHSYRGSYASRMHMLMRSAGVPIFESAKLGVIEKDTFSAWDVIRLILAGIETLSQQEQGDVYPITRVEFMWGGRAGLRGALLFDNRQRAQLHAVHAVLGHGGAGPTLCEQILGALGVPQQMFEQANHAVPRTSGYTVIFSREKTDRVDGVPEVALPYGEPGVWEWWLAS